MKVWGIIATVLLVVVAGFGVWQYMQNQDLTSQKNQLTTDLATANTAKTVAEAKVTADATKIAAVGKKVNVLAAFFKGTNSQAEAMAIYDMIKAINNETLNADWAAASVGGQSGNAAGTKLLQDLISQIGSDLK